MSLPTVFTVEDANRRLPYIRSIVRDVVTLAESLQQRKECLREVRLLHDDSADSDELDQMEHTIEVHRQQLAGFEKELQDIEVNLVDCYTGLIELRSQLDDRIMWLNWCPDEAEFVAWRTDDDDPTMRRPLLAEISDSNDAFTDNFQNEN